MLRIFHLADVHLCRPFRGLRLDPGRAVARTGELLETFSRAVQAATDERFDLMLVAGDLFEHDHVDRATLRVVMEAFAAFDRPVLIAPGNHDPATPDSPYRRLAWPHNVHIFGPSFSYLELFDKSLRVHGFGFDQREIRDHRLAEFRPEPGRDGLDVMVLHGSSMAGRQQSDGEYLPFTAHDLANSAMAYVALGHYHRRMVVEGTGRTVAAYPGSLESLNFTHVGPHGAYAVELDGTRVHLEERSYARREHRLLEVDVSDLSSSEQVLAKVLSEIPVEVRQRDICQVTLIGEAPLEGLSANTLRDGLADQFYALKVKLRVSPKADLERLSAEPTVRGRFVAIFKERLRQASPEEREMLLEALRVGLRALES